MTGQWCPRAARRRRRANGDDGAALIEAAIILPFLVLLVFGIVELGFMFRSAAVTNTSTRTGARLAASQYGSATTSASRLNVVDNVALTVERDLSSRGSTDTPSQLWIYQSDVNGFPPSHNFTTCADPCFVYTWNAGTGHFVRQSGSWDNPVVCGPSHDSIGVYVRVSHAPIGFSNFLGTLTLNEHTVMTLEPPNPNNCPTGS